MMRRREGEDHEGGKVKTTLGRERLRGQRRRYGLEVVKENGKGSKAGQITVVERRQNVAITKAEIKHGL